MRRVAVTVGMARVFFLDVRRIWQDERAEIARARSAEDSAAESGADQARQVPAMIQMRVGEDHRVDAARIDRQRRPVPLAQLLQSLEEPAVDEHAVIADVEQMLGAGDRAGGAEKRQRRHIYLVITRPDVSKIGRASCRERVEISVVAIAAK